VHLGARPDPGWFAGKQKAMLRACAEAGITPDQIGLAELYDAYAGSQLQSIAALGLSDTPVRDLDAGRFSPEGNCPVNLSGGLMGQGAPVGAIGVGQTATCAQLLEGRYHAALQPGSPPRYALADTHGGVGTTNAVTVLTAGGGK
jgi:acetyl-CoA C-acetyltransferase